MKHGRAKTLTADATTLGHGPGELRRPPGYSPVSSYEQRVTYEAHPTDFVPDDENALVDLQHRHLDAPQSHICAFAATLVRDGPVRLDYDGEFHGVDYVRTGEGYYRTYVSRNGTVYEMESVESTRKPVGWGWKEPPEWVVDVIRPSGWIGGVALLVWAGQVSVE